MNVAGCAMLCLVASVASTRIETAQFSDARESAVVRPYPDSVAYRTEVALWNAYRIHSRSQLAALLSASFVNVDPGGEVNKAEILAGLDNYHVAAVTVDLTGVTQLSESVILVRSHVRISHDWKGKSLPGDLTASTIWDLSSGRPVAVYHQDTAGS